MTNQETQKIRKVLSLRRRIEDYFRENPEDTLSMKDMSVKFDCKPASLKSTLARMRDEDIVESVPTVYRLKAQA